MTTPNSRGLFEDDQEIPFTDRDVDLFGNVPEQISEDADLDLEREQSLALANRVKVIEQLARSAAESSTATLARDRRAAEIELAHVQEDLDNRLIYLVNQTDDRKWPGKNEEERKISRETARLDDPVCQILDIRRGVLDLQIAAIRGELDARQTADDERKLAQKDAETKVSQAELALRAKYSAIDLRLRVIEMLSERRETLTLSDQVKLDAEVDRFLAAHIPSAE